MNEKGGGESESPECWLSLPLSVKKQVWFNLSLSPISHCQFSSTISVPGFYSDYQTVSEGQGLF